MLPDTLPWTLNDTSQRHRTGISTTEAKSVHTQRTLRRISALFILAHEKSNQEVVFAVVMVGGSMCTLKCWCQELHQMSAGVFDFISICDLHLSESIMNAAISSGNKLLLLPCCIHCQKQQSRKQGLWSCSVFCMRATQVATRRKEIHLDKFCSVWQTKSTQHHGTFNECCGC